jgi:DNA-binding CsgD family transcriptional regulator
VPGRRDSVNFTELRRILRLTSDLRDLPRASPEQRRCALEGLCELVGAQIGLWLQLTLESDDRMLVSGAIDLGWSSERERRAYLSYLDAQPRSIDPTHAPLARRLRQGGFTATRRQVLEDGEWYRSEHVQEFRRAGGVDDFMYGGRLSGDGVIAYGVSLHRPWGDRPFSERERRMVAAFHDETAWLYETPAPAPTDFLGELAPRQRDVLVLLVRGLSEKQVAADLQISQNTVHDYVKALYRRFGVNSRAELLAQFIEPGKDAARMTEKPLSGE